MSTLEALQGALAAEHASVYVLGVLGGQTSQSEQPERFELVSQRHAVHERRRDDLVAAVRRRGATPVAADAAYALPSDLGTPELVAAAGLELEGRCAVTYADLVSRSTGPLRGWAVDALAETARAQLAWGGEPEAFPGAPEL